VRALLRRCQPVTGTGSAGKSSIIREFTSKHLKYEKAAGDILGIFPVPRRGYAVGVSGSADNFKLSCEAREFMTRYDGLRAMIVASRSEGDTVQEVRRFSFVFIYVDRPCTLPSLSRL